MLNELHTQTGWKFLRSNAGQGIRVHVRQLAVIVLLPLLFAGCVFGDEDTETDVAEPRIADTDASPTSLASLPEGIEEVDVAIADGEFTVDEIILQENEPTVLHVINDDATDYRLRIVEDLVEETPIEANAVSDISFTTPNAAEYEAELLEADGDDVVATVRVVVLAPGGVQP